MAQANANTGGGNPIGNFVNRMFSNQRTGNPGDPGANTGQPGQGGQQRTQGQQGQQGQPPQGQQQGNQNNSGMTNDPQTQQTPLDAYKGLWDNADANAEQAPKFEIDGKIIDSTAANMDFMHNLPADLQETFESLGDQGPGFAKLLNHVGRKAYASAISHNSVLTGKYLDVKGQFDQKGLGRSIKQHMALTGIDSHKAAQGSPIVRENLRMIAQNLARLNPDATPEWIQEKSIKFFDEMANALNPKVQAAEQAQELSKQPGGMDFDFEAWMKQSPEKQE
jgi:hypothetical protein